MRSNCCYAEVERDTCTTHNYVCLNCKRCCAPYADPAFSDEQLANGFKFSRTTHDIYNSFKRGMLEGLAIAKIECNSPRSDRIIDKLIKQYSGDK